MIDRTEEALEIRIRHDGTVIWVNAKNGCLLRVCGVKNLTVIDEREMTVLPNGRCAVCRSRECICGEIEEMVREGWRVVKDGALFTPYHPDGTPYSVHYGDELEAWKYLYHKRKEDYE